ncbi:MAG: hypothetical protein ACE5FJ_07375 [Gemmatimonadales bacterium]
MDRPLSRLERLRCRLGGHDKKWEPAFFGPTWTCTKCGKSGGLREHARMTWQDWVIAAVPTAIAAWFLLKLLY